MYRTNPRLCQLEGEIGLIVPGALADLVVTDVDPLDDLAALADPEKTLSVIIARGQPVKNRLS
jgi:imidazolonepropionase-like amidohydrolase